jgi:hypothetical protein
MPANKTSLNRKNRGKKSGFEKESERLDKSLTRQSQQERGGKQDFC